MIIRSLSDHPSPYVVVAELAEYWGVSRRQIYTLVQTGALEAVRLGPQLVRIPRAAALAFERSVEVASIDEPALPIATPTLKTVRSPKNLAKLRPIHRT